MKKEDIKQTNQYEQSPVFLTHTSSKKKVLNVNTLPNPGLDIRCCVLFIDTSANSFSFSRTADSHIVNTLQFSIIKPRNYCQNGLHNVLRSHEQPDRMKEVVQQSVMSSFTTNEVKKNDKIKETSKNELHIKCSALIWNSLR